MPPTQEQGLFERVASQTAKADELRALLKKFIKDDIKAWETALGWLYTHARDEGLEIPGLGTSRSVESEHGDPVGNCSHQAPSELHDEMADDAAEDEEAHATGEDEEAHATGEDEEAHATGEDEAAENGEAGATGEDESYQTNTPSTKQTNQWKSHQRAEHSPAQPIRKQSSGSRPTSANSTPKTGKHASTVSAEQLNPGNPKRTR